MPLAKAVSFDKKRGGFNGFGQSAFGGRQKILKATEAAIVRPPDMDSAEFEYTVGKIKNAATAKRVMNLKEQFPNGTTPELVTMDWLNRHEVRYQYQAQYGARTQRGSAAPDFVVSSAGRGYAWEINGVYWHTAHKTPSSDASRALQLMNKTIGGIVISGVVPLWEPDIYSRPEQVFAMAMVGERIR